MADFAPNFTARYVVAYSTLGLTHHNLFRIARGAGVAGLNNMILKVTAFYDALENARYTDWSVLSATYTPEDSDISLPAAAPSPVAGTQVIPAAPNSQKSLTLGFVGRSNQGQKARLFVYGCSAGPEEAGSFADDWRITSVESAAVSGAVAVLNNGSPNIVASDDAVVGWYAYANVKYNDYWLRKTRS